MNEGKRKYPRSPLILLTHCAKNSDIVNTYDYFLCYLKDLSYSGACLVSSVKIKKRQVLALVLEIPESLVSKLKYARIVWVKEQLFGFGTVYTAGIKFFDMRKALKNPNVIRLSSVVNTLVHHANTFRNTSWLSIKPCRCFSQNTSGQ